jgi:hypothetical protein
MTDPDLDILDRSLDCGGRVLSPLTRWMVAHHDDFSALLRRKGVHWQKLCEGFAKLGIRNADGQPLTPRTARETWLRVRKRIARYRDEGPSPAQPRTISDRPQASPVAAGAAEPAGGPEFQPVRLRSGYRSADAAERFAAKGGPVSPPPPRAGYVAIDPEFAPADDQSDFQPVPGRLKRLLPPSPLVEAARAVADEARRAATPRDALLPNKGTEK